MKYEDLPKQTQTLLDAYISKAAYHKFQIYKSYQTYSPTIDIQDFIQAGYLGVLDLLAHRFDKNKIPISKSLAFLKFGVICGISNLIRQIVGRYGAGTETGRILPFWIEIDFATKENPNFKINVIDVQESQKNELLFIENKILQEENFIFWQKRLYNIYRNKKLKKYIPIFLNFYFNELNIKEYCRQSNLQYGAVTQAMSDMRARLRQDKEVQEMFGKVNSCIIDSSE